MIHIYTGDGKGKTTAAAGLAARALGAGLRVFFAQFIKDGSSPEIQFLQNAGGNNFQFFSRGRGKFIRNTPEDEDCRRAAETLTALNEALRSGKYELVAADEIFGSLHANLFRMEELFSLLNTAKQYPEVELILTGRNAPDHVIRLADLVSEIRCVKHYYSQGRPPKRGIEW